MDLDVGFVEESSVTYLTVMHHLLPLVSLASSSSSPSSSITQKARGVGHLLLAVVLLLHHPVIGLLLDDGVGARVASELAPEDGGEDGGEGLPVLEAGHPGTLVVGLG